MTAKFRIGVDLGGTKIEAAALDPEGRIVLRRRIPAPQGSYTGTVEAITSLVKLVEGELGEQGSVGVGMPGTISPATGLVKNANSLWLRGKPFDRDLARSLDREVRTANDANCFALSEAKDGAGAGAKTVFGVILGTGVGGGIVIDGNVLVGRHAIAGEWGHNLFPVVVDREAEPYECYCGKIGCIETYLSGKGLSRTYARISGSLIAADEVANRLAAGEAMALEAMNLYCDRLARALSSIVNVLDPDAIVLGGGVSNIGMIYNEVPKQLAGYVYSDVCTTPILKNMHGDSSGVRGAAWLWGE